MFLAQVYKLKPTSNQSQQMEDWLNMLRALYNFSLRDRIDAYEQAKAPILGNFSILSSKAEACPLTCSISKNAIVGDPFKNNGKKRNAYEQQSSNLPLLKVSRPWYKKIHSTVLQQTLKQLDEAFKKFFNEKTGYPKFKNKSKFRSFTYPPNQVKIDNNKIYLPSIGWIGFYLSRPRPLGFELKSVTVRKKANGWYVSIRLEDKNVPQKTIIDKSQIKTAIGCDLGINKLVSLSNEETIANPKFNEQVKRRKTIRARRASHKKKGSKNRQKAYQSLAKLEQKTANKRADFQWKVAHKIANLGDVIVFEDLNIKGMMKRCRPKLNENGKHEKNGQSAKAGLNKAIADAGWGDLKLKVQAVAEKLGLYFVEVEPNHTSQTCHHCGCVDKSNRKGEKFICTDCGWIEDADTQAGKNILAKGLKLLGVNLPQLLAVSQKVTSRESSQIETSLALADEPANPRQVKQLSLFDLMGGCWQ